VRQVTAVATLPNFSRDDVQSELVLPNNADINRANNRAAIEILNPVTTQQDPGAVVSDAIDNQLVTIATAGNASSSSGVTQSAAAKVGAVSRQLLLVFLVFVLIAAVRFRFKEKR